MSGDDDVGVDSMLGRAHAACQGTDKVVVLIQPKRRNDQNPSIDWIQRGTRHRGVGVEPAATGERMQAAPSRFRFYRASGPLFPAKRTSFSAGLLANEYIATSALPAASAFTPAATLRTWLSHWRMDFTASSSSVKRSTTASVP